MFPDLTMVEHGILQSPCLCDSYTESLGLDNEGIMALNDMDKLLLIIFAIKS